MYSYENDFCILWSDLKYMYDNRNVENSSLSPDNFRFLSISFKRERIIYIYREKEKGKKITIEIKIKRKTVSNISIILRYILKYHTLHASLCKSDSFPNIFKNISRILYSLSKKNLDRIKLQCLAHTCTHENEDWVLLPVNY